MRLGVRGDRELLLYGTRGSLLQDEKFWMAVRAAHENVLNATELRTQSW